MASPIVFKDCTAAELHAGLAKLGVSARLARRLQAAIFQRRAPEIPARLTEVPARLLASIRAATLIPKLTLLEKAVSPQDGFAKYLFRGTGGSPARLDLGLLQVSNNTLRAGEPPAPRAEPPAPSAEPFETVRIPLMHRPHDRKYIVCVSSQVGCAMGCGFCATARLGFRRNLEAWEIVDQVLQVQADSPHPVRGVVFMGMGEPMLNYDRVMRTAQILSEPCGMAIAAKAITISTVGIVPMIRRFTAERRPYRLVVSLTSADPRTRRELLPVEHVHPLPELMAAMREYCEATGKRVTLAWTMMSGVNTRPEDARQLAALTAGLPIVLDLIDVNDPTGRFHPPSEAELNTFRDALTAELGMPVVRRYSGGQDIAGGCGMLAGRAVG